MKAMAVKRIRNALMVLCLAPWIPAVCSWADGLRFGLAGEYQNTGIDARVAALGSAFAGLADNAAAWDWNPAGLGQARLIHLEFSHAFMGGNSLVDQLAFLQPLPGAGAMGFGLKILNQDGYALAAGTHSAVLRDALLGMAFGTEIVEGFSVGAGVKGHTLNWDSAVAAALDADVGLFYRTPWPALAAGAALQNMAAPALASDVFENQWARLIRLGLSLSLWDNRCLLSVEAARALAENASWDLGGGLEFNPWPALSVRLGCRDQCQPATGDRGRVFSCGLGWNRRDWHLDYAAVRDQGWSHRLSFSFVLGTYNARLAANPVMFSSKSVNKVCHFTIDLPDKEMVRAWEFVIRLKINGKSVRTVSGEKIPEEVVWDGLDDQNEFLPEGVYTGELIGHDRWGNELRSNLAEVSIREPISVKVTTQKESGK